MTTTTEAGAPPQGAPAASRGLRIEATIFVVFLIALSIAGLILTATIKEPAASITLGPRVIPFVVTGLMLVSSVGVLISQLRGNFAAPEEGEDIDESGSTSWTTVVILVLSFLSLMITIPWAGWPVAVMVLFAGSAIALGAKKWWLAVLVGLGLGIVTQILFGTLLGLSLPPTGYLTEWLPVG